MYLPLLFYGGNEMEKTNDWVFHNTELLLKNYRDVVWSLEVAIHRVNRSFMNEFGSDIEGFLEMTYDAGMDLRGSELEAQAKNIAKSRNMLSMIDAAVDLLRKKHKNGEIYYWILYYTYLSPQELQSVEEIIEKLTDYMKDISQRTYFRKKNEAIRQLGSILWGYTSKECSEILSKFV